MPISETYCCDCLEFMRQQPAKRFDLAIADPPYGIGEDGAKAHTRGKIAKPIYYTPKNWDNAAPGADFFNELCRISKRQIIWGANHFIENLPQKNASCWIVWDKENGTNDFADCELAYTNFPTAVRLFRFRWNGMLQGNMKHKEQRIHPTQKPIALYSWILSTYGGGVSSVFDPMMGSQSSRIAAYKMGFDYWGCELDREYYDRGCERFERECHGIITAPDGRTVQQLSLF